jgi:hypothetical protein
MNCQPFQNSSSQLMPSQLIDSTFDSCHTLEDFGLRLPSMMEIKQIIFSRVLSGV